MNTLVLPLNMLNSSNKEKHLLKSLVGSERSSISQAGKLDSSTEREKSSQRQQKKKWLDCKSSLKLLVYHGQKLTDDPIITRNSSSWTVMSKMLSSVKQICRKSTRDSIHSIPIGKQCEEISPQKHSTSKTKLVSIFMATGTNSRAFAAMMVTSTTPMYCMRLVLSMVVLSTGCGSIVRNRVSTSSVLPSLVFVFSHRYSFASDGLILSLFGRPEIFLGIF